jgi:transcriptional regulator with XRE-family HTH domain
MPKKSKIETPLRKLREITGKSQEAFARVLGCSLSAIKQIERGDYSKFSDSLIMSLTNVFGVSPDSMLPPSTQPTECFGGKPYTKEFFEDWWKNGAGQINHHTLEQKSTMVRDLKMVLAAAMRVPGRAFGGVFTSYYNWLTKLMDNCQLWPHYEAELNERMGRAKKTTNPLHADLEFGRLFRQNKSKFIQEAFESEVRPTTLMRSWWERRNRDLKKELPIKPKKKLSKLEKLKAQKYEITYILTKTLSA